jgi:hypothetical protein
MIDLDTHVVVWLYAFGSKKLSEQACELLERSPKLLISPMVLLELEFLQEIGKLAVFSWSRTPVIAPCALNESAVFITGGLNALQLDLMLEI